MDPYLGEIRLFAGNFAPEDWKLCDGSELPLNDYQALYAVIGLTYGGDGRTTFALPDLRGRVPIHYGQGAKLTNNYALGQSGGTETITLTAGQNAAHNHQVKTNTATVPLNPTNTPDANSTLATGPQTYIASTPAPTAFTTLNNAAISYTGGGQAHANLMPSMVLSYIICTNGLFPTPPQ